MMACTQSLNSLSFVVALSRDAQFLVVTLFVTMSVASRSLFAMSEISFEVQVTQADICNLFWDPFPDSGISFVSKQESIAIFR
jgi:hypothetical protein